jgi:hypothetical protein
MMAKVSAFFTFSSITCSAVLIRLVAKKTAAFERRFALHIDLKIESEIS